ncbi:IQ calmodulin-binding motif protein [Pleurostoma richardsiae]|uniref:IQ calmodulin-binding motif protein n=1 Tax=Pleurostoma richardsiae TaxID=41990 RepID=A0AA38S1K9_9PEZI|nr:IQ calmodulin-binding motif protein [Pleurostoma richardsiae]
MQNEEGNQIADRSTSSPPTAPPQPLELPLTPPTSPPLVPEDNGAGASSSKLSLPATPSSRSRKQYMDSLVVPSNEEFARISDVQVHRETEQKRRSRDLQRERRSMDKQRRSRSSDQIAQAPSEQGRRSRPSIFKRGNSGSVDDSMRAKAAVLIQRTYRGYRTRREMKGLGLDASTRWVQAIREAQFRQMTTPRARPTPRGESAPPGQDERTVLEHPADGSAASRSATARHNWKKASTIARRAGGDADTGDDSSSSDSSSTSSSDESMTSEQKKAERLRREQAKERRRKEAQMMGLQYFLEMVDLKHRYGSNLRVYHEEWKNTDTNENFFYWLDYGEGRNLDMTACPRERLDRERVRYLSREERQYYLVTVDEQGRLCWAKNGARIDTTEKYRDSIHGIVPADDPTPAFQALSENPTRLLGDSSTGESSDSDASESELEAARAAKYADGPGNAKGMKKVSHISATTVMNQLLRKSVRKNTWIFVADTSFRLYVGIKNSGAFQHSSFLQGSRISAAGLIKIRNGRLTSLSPLSGHYRPPASSFRAFVRSLKEEGVDMSRVSISKSYAVLVGLEFYMKTRRKGKELVQKATRRREKMVHPEEVRRQDEALRDKSQSAAAERRFLEEQEERGREENSAGVQLMQKLHLSPRVPAGQKGGGDEEEENVAGAGEVVGANIER